MSLAVLECAWKFVCSTHKQTLREAESMNAKHVCFSFLVEKRAMKPE